VQWIKPVILATWEAEIGKITIQDQFRQEVSETPSQPIKAVYGGMRLLSQLHRKCVIGGSQSRPDPISKGMAHVAEFKVLSSNPSTTERKKAGKGKRQAFQGEFSQVRLLKALAMQVSILFICLSWLVSAVGVMEEAQLHLRSLAYQWEILEVQGQRLAVESNS
jgi:hypothetical protein